MATGFPTKANWSAGDVLTASQMDDLAGTVNYLSPVGQTNGSTLVANSANASGLGWNQNFAAGKNAIINGDCRIAQRGTTGSLTGATRVFVIDRFSATGNGTYSQQTFTPGTAPVAGYEGKYFARWDLTSNSQNYDFITKLEDARLFAGQTATLSFWAKASSANANVFFPRIAQNFGTGGSPSATVYTDGAAIALTTSWARYTATFSVPSITGKTFGTNNDSFLGVVLQLNTTSAITIDLWGFQLEAGSVATAFQTATGTLQGELAACQRYYYRANSSSSYGWIGSGIGYNTTSAAISTVLPSQMRVPPTAVEFSTLALNDGTNNTTVTTCTIDTNQTANNTAVCNISAASGIVQYRPYYIRMNASASAYIGFTAEL